LTPASTKQLKGLQKRDLRELDLLAIVLDGKTFVDMTMVVALGITLTGPVAQTGECGILRSRFTLQLTSGLTPTRPHDIFHSDASHPDYSGHILHTN